MEKLKYLPPLFGLLLLAGGCAAGPREVAPAPTVRPAVEDLEGFIAAEMEAQELPGLSIALWDGDRVVWAKGFGYADAARKTPAAADTVYRVASISKLFTAIAVLREVEAGRLDLDARVSRYLPDFHPRNTFGKEVTLRHLLSHHSGLVREPPAGHYFDPAPAGLGPTVASLNQTQLVYAPETRFKYSNAGVTVAGQALERVTGLAFEHAVEKNLLRPLGLRDSSFHLTPSLRSRLATGYMWTYDGRVFEAPTFQLGMGPAGNLSTTVLDLVRFAREWWRGEGEADRPPLLKPATLESMWKGQFTAAGKTSGIGLGFFFEDLEGHRAVGHGGAIYGFASQVLALPADRLAVAVVTNVDFANGSAERVARRALSNLLAARNGKPFAPVVKPAPVDAARARFLAGTYGDGRRWIDVQERVGELFVEPSSGFRARIRLAGNALVVSDRIRSRVPDGRPDLEEAPGGVKWNGTFLPKLPDEKPAPLPDRWRDLVGDYGWDHDVLYVLERRGSLAILIEWFAYYPLEEKAADRYALSDSGLYLGEAVQFLRGPDGKVSGVRVGGVVFPRRTLEGEQAEVFRIRPQAPVETLRAAALAASPPVEKGPFREPELVDLATLDPELRFDIRYATTRNFLGTAFYPEPRAFLQRPAAEALARAHRSLKARGYGLLIHDAYRPWHVTRMFWDGTPEAQREFVADPNKGSRHNRGAAVDLTLYELATGRPVDMVSLYDEFTPRAYPGYPGGSSLARWHRDLLRRAMEDEGFTVFPKEWWHFDHATWKEYPILNLGFDARK